MYSPRPAGQEPRILAERDGVVALFKPADLPTTADHRGQHSLLQWASEHLKIQDLHATSRLDVGVSGVVLLACDRRARERLVLAREQGHYHRTYLALVPPGSPDAGTWTWAIGKGKGHLQAAKPEGTPNVLGATTHFSTLTVTPRAALLKVEPITGRTHQIRVHCAEAGRPIYGDSSYGGSSKVVASNGAIVRATRIGLHAFRVEAPDRRGTPWRVEAPVPEDYLNLWRALEGGEFPEVP